VRIGGKAGRVLLSTLPGRVSRVAVVVAGFEVAVAVAVAPSRA
jgi:hypothetical protein